MSLQLGNVLLGILNDLFIFTNLLEAWFDIINQSKRLML